MITEERHSKQPWVLNICGSDAGKDVSVILRAAEAQGRAAVMVLGL